MFFVVFFVFLCVGGFRGFSAKAAEGLAVIGINLIGRTEPFRAYAAFGAASRWLLSFVNVSAYVANEFLFHAVILFE